MHRSIAPLGWLCGLLLVVADARASLTPIFSPGELAVGGVVTWPGADLAFLSNPSFVSVAGAEPLLLLLSAPDAIFLRRNTSTSWTGSALPAGTDLVWADGASGPVSLAFGSDVQGVGFYVEAELVANTILTLEGFDGDGQSLGAVQQFAPLGSGFFWGVRSDQQDLRTLVVSSSFDRDIVLSGPMVQVPEPGMIGLLLVGAGACGWRRRRGRMA